MILLLFIASLIMYIVGVYVGVHIKEFTTE